MTIQVMAGRRKITTVTKMMATTKSFIRSILGLLVILWMMRCIGLCMPVPNDFCVYVRKS